MEKKKDQEEEEKGIESSVNVNLYLTIKSVKNDQVRLKKTDLSGESIDMIGVDVSITNRVHEIAWLQTGHMSHHVCQQ